MTTSSAHGEQTLLRTESWNGLMMAVGRQRWRGQRKIRQQHASCHTALEATRTVDLSYTSPGNYQALYILSALLVLTSILRGNIYINVW